MLIKNLLKILAEGVNMAEAASLNLEVSLRMKERPTNDEVEAMRDAGAMLNIITDRLAKTESEMWKIAVKEEAKVLES